MADILAISGSLRAASFNTMLIRAAQKLAPEGLDIELYDRLGDIPPYDMDADGGGASEPVVDLRSRIGGADALLIATPEYNYSIPGVLKNALDWASTPPDANVLRGKPVALMGASPSPFGTVRAQLALRQVFLWTGSPVVAGPEVLVFNAFERFDENGELIDEGTIGILKGLLDALRTHLGEREPATATL